MRANYLPFFLLAIFSSYNLITAIAQNTHQYDIQSTGRIIYDNNMLRVNGIKLVNGYGNEVILVGSQADWNEKMKRYGSTSLASPGEPTWFSEEDVIKIKEEGGNCIELHSIRLGELMPDQNIIDEAFFTNWLDKWVSWCADNEIYAIINIRNFATTKPDSYLTMPDWMWLEAGYSRPTTLEEQDEIVHAFYDSDMSNMDANRDAFISLWEFIANRYKNEDYVLYGIINEPLHHTWQRTNDDYLRHLGEEYSQFMTRLIEAIRYQGANQVIMIDKPYVRYLSYVQPINKPNIVWEAHLYISSWNPDISTFESRFDELTDKFVIDFNKPLYLGEYGIDPPEYIENLPDWQATLSEEVNVIKISSLCGWSWHTYGFLEGEYYDYINNYFTDEESQWILQTICNSK